MKKLLLVGLTSILITASATDAPTTEKEIVVSEVKALSEAITDCMPNLQQHTIVHGGVVEVANQENVEKIIQSDTGKRSQESPKVVVEEWFGGMPKTQQDTKLLSDVNVVTSNLLTNAKAVEPEITQLLQTIGKNSNATLAGLDYRLKSHDSLKRKITSIVRRRNIKASEAADDINDALRYTYLLNEKDFVRQFKQIRNSLEQQGHKVTYISNTWRKKSIYKGINTTFNINGQSYELQFHTADSFALKNGKLHELYEQFRADNVSESVKKVLREQMVALSEQIKQPAKIETIRNQKGK